MTTAPPRKLGVLVAIPIKGRKLVNRSGGKQSPYVQLRLGNQNKRTKASLIAAIEPEWDQEVRLDVFQGQLDMRVSVHDEGKKNELIGEGILMLHEVIDKGELDVWFPIKVKGAPTGDVYFELTFYAVAPPPRPGVVVNNNNNNGSSPLYQRPSLRYAQRNLVPGPAGASGGRPLPNVPAMCMLHGRPIGPPAPFAGNTYQHPIGYSPGAIPYPVPGQHQLQQQQPQQQQQMRPTVQTHSYPSPSSSHFGPPSGPVFHPVIVGASPSIVPSTFRPSTQYAPPSRPVPGSHQNVPPFPNGPTTSNNYPSNAYQAQNNNPLRTSVSMPSSMPVPHPYSPSTSYAQTSRPGQGHGQGQRPSGYPMLHNRPNTYQQQNNHNMQTSRPPPTGAMGPVTPMRQYNYTLGSFP